MILYTSQCKRDFKKAEKQNKDFEKFRSVIKISFLATLLILYFETIR